MTIANIALLRTTAGTSPNEFCDILGYTTPGDGGGGHFYWDSTSITADNGGTIIAVTGVATGRWKRVLDEGRIDVKWFGVQGTVADSGIIQTIIDQYAGIYPLYFPAGTYYISGVNVFNKNGAVIFGDNSNTTLITSAGPIFNIKSTTYDPVHAPVALVKSFEMYGLTLKGNLTGGLPTDGTEGIRIEGVINVHIHNIKYSGLDKVVNQVQCECSLFEDITPVDLENRQDDANYIIYSDAQNRRSNDNIYTKVRGVAKQSQVYLKAEVASGGMHDGASISECVFFQCAKQNIYINEARYSTISDNKLFVAGEEAIYLSNPAGVTITGNTIVTPGNVILGNGITLYFTAGVPLFGKNTIIGNIIRVPTKNGIEVIGADGGTIMGNIITSPSAVNRVDFHQLGLYAGIKISNSKNIEISSNTVHPLREGESDTTYPANWKADIEIDAFSAVNVYHNVQLEGKLVINNSNNTTVFSNLPEIPVSLPTSGDLTNGVFGYTITNWTVNNTSGISTSTLTNDNTIDRLDNTILPFSIRADWADTIAGSSWMERGIGLVAAAGDNFVLSVTMRTAVGQTARIALQMYTTNDGANGAIRYFDVNDTWQRFYLSFTSKEALIPVIRIISAGQTAKTVYFSPIQLYRTKSVLPVFNRVCTGTAIPTVGVWYRTDTVLNSNIQELGAAGSKYIIEGWNCVTSGNPGSWLEKRALTGH